MASVMLVFSCLLSLTLMPVSGTATAATAEIFPSLRKRKQQQQLAAIQTSKKVKAPDTENGESDEAESEADEAADASQAAAPAVADGETSVPAVADLGKDGFPQLPAVNQMLSGASGTLKAVNSQASVLEAHAVQAQMQIESRMAKEKAAFEERLKQQEKGNRDIIAANDKISGEIKALNEGNTALKKNAHEIEKTNEVMRGQLQKLESSFGVAKSFTAKSLFSTDDSDSALLQVLHGKALVQTSSKSKSAAKDDDDDDEDDDDEEDQGTSFLSVKMKVRRAPAGPSEPEPENVGPSLDAAVTELEPPVPKPENLLDGLAREIAQLANQEKESQKNLKQMFIRDFRAGAKRKAALLQQQKNLTATRTSLQTLQGKLKSAQEHLQTTQNHLQSRLHGLGQYLQKLAYFAMAPPNEVPHLLKVLPNTVSLKEKHM